MSLSKGPSDKGHRNRLQYEKSPYLLQHAGNPVDWRPWGEPAFEAAAGEDKPIFLSIGYSTCHWCHVMERESFEDPQVAAMLNETFVCIKVDREERPDIDNIYMAVCQMLTGSGGWPLTIMMSPDRSPFYAATYIPKEGRYGLAGLVDIVPRVRTLWRTRREELLAEGRRHVERLRRLMKVPAATELGSETVVAAFNGLAGRYDEANGGFGTAPKFPTPHNLSFLLRYWKRTRDGRALAMVEKTLKEMRRGGIYDHVGFGFHRYSTDAFWLVPHFEKMLYDNALLARVYLNLWRRTGSELARRVAEETCEWMARELGTAEQPMRLLRSVRGATWCEIPSVEECCGFGGTFSVKMPGTSLAMGRSKAANVVRSGAEVVVSADISCLMHLGGILQCDPATRHIRTMHIAEVLAAR